MVCRSRSRFMTVDHIRGTVYATMIIMRVMMTMTPASVKPDSPDLPGLVGSPIESIAGGLAVYFVDARRRVFRCRGGIGRHRVGVRRVGRVLYFFPIRLAGHRVFGNAAEVMFRHECLETLRILLLVGIV